MSGRPVLGRMRRGVLRMLADAGPAGLESKDMAPLATKTRLGQQQNEVNRTLAGLGQLGLVTRGERDRSPGAPYRWYITAEGTAAARKPATREAAAASRARNEERSHAAHRALEAARAAGHGPCTPLAVQLEVRAGLRAAGCTYRQIGDLFGVARQAICKSLAGAGER